MKTWLVDTNVLIDVLHADPQFGQPSLQILEERSVHDAFIINAVIYAEIAAWVTVKEQMDALLPPDLFRREPIPMEAAFLAGRAYRRYKDRRGGKRRMLADFLIGAHAAVRGYGLITRDRGYRKYFEVEILDPSTTTLQ